MDLNTNKVVVKILHGSVVTQTVLGGLTVYSSQADFLCAKNYESWLAVDKVIATIKRFTFWPTLDIGL